MMEMRKVFMYDYSDHKNRMFMWIHRGKTYEKEKQQYSIIFGQGS